MPSPDEPRAVIVTLLGTGSPLGTPVLGCSCPTCETARERGIERTRCAAHVRNGRTGESLLVDAGPDVRRQLAGGTGGADGRDLPDAVVITHVHFDHCAGLDDLTHYRDSLPVYAADAGLTVPEPNAGASVAGVLRDRFRYAGTLSISDRAPYESFETCGFEVTLVPVNHGRIACYGVCIEDPTTGAKLAITSDTSYAVSERSRAAFAEPDLLIAESLVPASVESEWPADRPGRKSRPTWDHRDPEGVPRSLRGSHLTHEGALALGRDLDATRVRLTHASHYYPPEQAFSDPMARDGERWEL